MYGTANKGPKTDHEATFEGFTLKLVKAHEVGKFAIQMFGEGNRDKTQLMEFWSCEVEEQKVYNHVEEILRPSLTELAKGFKSVKRIPAGVPTEIRARARNAKAEVSKM